MKKALPLLSLILLVCLSSCKKEASEPETIAKIKVNVLQKSINNADFNKNIYPLVQELYEKDSLKYKLIHHIAEKAKTQKEKEILKMNLENLKEELKYLK
jgi:predicted component of type VI protein secretion system